MNLQASVSGGLLEWVAVADFVEFIAWGYLALRPGLQPGCRIPREKVRSRVLCVECFSPLLSCQSKHLRKLLAVIYSV